MATGRRRRWARGRTITGRVPRRPFAAAAAQAATVAGQGGSEHVGVGAAGHEAGRPRKPEKPLRHGLGLGRGPLAPLDDERGRGNGRARERATSAARRGEDGSAPAPASDGARAKAAATPGALARASASQPPRPWPPTTSGSAPQRAALSLDQPPRVVEHLGAEAPAARALAARLPGDHLEPLRHGFQEGREPGVVEGHPGVEVEDEAGAGLVPGGEPKPRRRGSQPSQTSCTRLAMSYRPISSAIGTSAAMTKATCSSRGRPRASAPP